MNKSLRFLLPAATVALMMSAPACVSAYGRPYGGQYANAGRIAYDNGYRRGFDHGVEEARAGRAGNYRNDRAYRDADWGYDRRYGPRGQYRQVFRDGYEAGYRDGYSRSRGGSYGGRAVPRYEPGYGRSAPRGGYGGYGYGEAFERGRREGYEKGREDARDRDRYDPVRHKWYREGDRGYNSRYGSREQYKDSYRDAFRQGYQEGYRDAQGRW
jgi:hypothetical protein